MKSVIAGIGVIILLSLTGEAVEVSRTEFSAYLGKDQKVVSPNGNYTCWTERLSADRPDAFDTVNLLINLTS